MPTDPMWLKDRPCFEKISNEQLRSIAQITQVVCYSKGHVLCKENESGEKVFFMVKGDVEVLYNIGEADQVSVDSLHNEEVFGCSALVEPYTYTETVRCLTQVEMLAIDAVELRALMERDCDLGVKLQKHIISRLMAQMVNLRLKQPLGS